MAKGQELQKDDTVLQAKLGAVIRTCRHQLGITQEELAWRANMHRTYIADIERGVRNITLRSVTNLADALKVSAASLLASATGMGDPNGGLGGILMIEDNEEDAEMALRAFREAKFTNPIRTVRDGAEAIALLSNTNGTNDGRKRVLPQLILLDLNLPKVSGLDVLRSIKSEPRTRDIPVVVLTVSQRGRDIAECRRLGVESYLLKPVSFENFCRLTPKLGLNWVLTSAEAAPAL